jgi:two-component sensor histidine kinase/DNA-binding response OmpR family regulator
MTDKHTGNILVVDDSPSNIQLLTEMLSRGGHTIHAATDGMRAIRAVSEMLPDLILLDIIMPVMDGFKVCQYLKNREETRDIPVIFMTSLSDTKDKIRGFELGAADYITKPFQPEEVLARVENLLALCIMQKRLEANNAELTRSNRELERVNKELSCKIAEHRQIEIALQENEERLRTLINAMPDIVAFKDGEGRWLEANDFDLGLFELEDVDYRGKKDSDLAEFTPFYREALLQCEASDEIAWLAGSLSRADETIPRPNSPPMIFDIIKVPIFHPDGKRKGLVVVGRDVTDRMRAESELKRYQGQLEQMVNERTAELAEANSHLQNEIAERMVAEGLVKASLAEKEVLLKEVHHRVKNNMQIVSTLLDLQSEGIRDEEALKAFRESQDRIKAMALIHERLYESADIVFIDFQRYIEELSAHLFDSYLVEPGRITLHVDAGGVTMGIDRAIPCGLIINELVTNSLKHAFPDNRQGKIRVLFRTGDDGQISLEVADNGVGLPAGLEITKTASLGLQLVHMLARQLRGVVRAENGATGAQFVIGFPGS